MSSARKLRRGRTRFGEVVLLALALSVASLASPWLLAHAIVGPAGRGSATGPPDILITAALAVLAAWAGISIASLMGLDGRGWGAALNKSALATLGFTLLTAGFGVSAALMSAAVEFPVLLVAAVLVGRWRARHAEDPLLTPVAEDRKGRLRRFVYVTLVLPLVSFSVITSGMASAASADTISSAPVTATHNPCTTAPHDTFNISAINVDITLNKYGVHDPNSFMYVLNSNIAAVRAEEAAGTV